MNISKHISISFTLGLFMPNYTAAVVMGLVSHAILDLLPQRQYKINLFQPGEDKDILAVEIAISAILLYLSLTSYNWVLIATILAGISPDIIDGILAILNNQRYEQGEHLFWFHKPNNSTQRTKLQSVILSIILFLTAITIMHIS